MNIAEENVEGSEEEVETRCGIFNWFPDWLQFMTSKKSYVVLFGLIGMNQLAISSYSVATITTLEKRFKIPSKTSGIIQGGWDIGTIVSSIMMAYIGSKGHKTRWVAFGTLLTSIACYSQLLPYVLFGPGNDAINIAKQATNTTNSSLHVCHLEPVNSTQESPEGEVSNTPPLLIFISQVILGIGTSMYWTLGLAYLDDNVRKNQTPMLISISATIRLFGSPIGFWLAGKALEYYVDPSLSPSITDKDARWIGAWWIGWIPLGITATAYSALLALFPRVLPRALQRIKKKKQENDKIENNQTGGKQDFIVVLKRLLKNRLLICSIFSYVFYMFGVIGYWVFMPKYMETQFHMTATNANLVTGTMGLLSSAVGVILSGFVVSYLKPSARKITGWNVCVEALGALSMLVYAQLACSTFNLHGKWAPNNSWDLSDECNSECNCGPSIPYEPVCDSKRSVTFYSPCHAGCRGSQIINKTKMFINCSCIEDTFALDSICPVDCEYNLIVFLVLYCFTSFLASTSHSGLAIIQFRAVAPEDKSVSIALSEMLASVLAYIPGPIIYGELVDNACLVWGYSGKEKGNCWLYYDKQFRHYLNYTAAGFLFIALMFDCGVWYYSKNLVLYDDDEEENSESGSADGDLKKKKTPEEMGASKRTNSIELINLKS